MRLHRNAIAAVPFCHLTFLAVRPVRCHRERAEVETGTLGAAFGARRAESSREAASWIGVSVATYRGWEVNRSVPAVKHLPGVIAFLGYDWRPPATTSSMALRRTRTAKGLALKALARELHIEWTTLRRWKRAKESQVKR